VCTFAAHLFGLRLFFFGRFQLRRQIMNATRGFRTFALRLLRPQFQLLRLALAGVSFLRRSALLAEQPGHLRLAQRDAFAKLTLLFAVTGGFRDRLLEVAARILFGVVHLRQRFRDGVALLGQHGVPRERTLHTQRAQFLGELGEPPRLARLDLQAALAGFDFAEQVAQAFQVFLGPLELALRLLPTRAVLRDACRFLENGAALHGVGAQKLVDIALLHDRHGAGAPAGVHHQLAHVPQADGVLVDQVLALAGAVEPAADRDLFVVDVERRIRVVEDQRDLREADTLSPIGAGEDDVLHLLAAQARRTLFAEHPLDRIDDVALAAAVGPDDDVDAVVEAEFRFVREALEAVQDEFLDLHVDAEDRGEPPSSG